MATVIVDDEKPARDELAYLLGAFADIELVGQGQNGLEAIKLVQKHQPQLLFLDAQMPGLDGFGVVKALEARRVAMPHLVFATAYDQYAVQAFEVNAVDYLLKPFDRERLARTIEKVRRQAAAGDAVAGKIDRVIAMLGERKAAARPRILMKAGGRQYLLDAGEIVYAKIEDGAITLATRQMEGQAAYRTLEELQADLDASRFWRAHRGWLVNLEQVQEVVPWFNSSYQLRMNDRKHSEVPVSRGQSKRLRELYRL